MELVLTQADFDAMPTKLRHELFVWLSRGEAYDQAGEGLPLNREQAIALLREVSFHPAGARLKALIDRLAYADTARPPSKRRLIEALNEDGGRLGRYVATLNRLTSKVTGRPKARLCEYHKLTDGWSTHAATRAILRELLSTMKASGAREEPLWERAEASS